jgi:hypothetical protein
MKTFDDLSIPEQIAVLRDCAVALRTGRKDADWVRPEYRDGLADRLTDFADRLEAGEDPFEEAEESPEKLRAEAEQSRKIAEMMRREGIVTLNELFEGEPPDAEDLN